MGIETHIEGAIHIAPALPLAAINDFWAKRYVRFVESRPEHPDGEPDGYSAIVADHDDGWFKGAYDTIYALANLLEAWPEPPNRKWQGHFEFQIEDDHPSSWFRASVAKRADRYDVVVTWCCHEHGTWPDPRLRGVVLRLVPDGRHFTDLWSPRCTCL
ncbi:hypothetical protein [Nocardia tengchongensis]|uniref:hypothetical protein n=1 Tax=Nocardia tengchongensis TaxID=2055889 RepID=UPI0036698EA4